VALIVNGVRVVVELMVEVVIFAGGKVPAVTTYIAVTFVTDMCETALVMASLTM